MNDQVSSIYDVVVVGAGLIGSAAARHLAEMGTSVALIGPAEPAEKAHHSGVFASHYDEARITRYLATDRDWSRFSSASIRRYAALEEKSGIRFFSNVGALMAGPEEGSDFIRSVQAVAASEGGEHVALKSEALKTEFPYLAFPDGIMALYEPTAAGWINPRRHVAAEINVAQAGGAHLHRSEVTAIHEGEGVAIVHCDDGHRFQAGKVIVACGAFSNAGGLLPEPIPLTVYARTIAFLEIDTEEAARLQAMPSIIYHGPGGTPEVYILPPVQYPDGKTYLKIGGDPVDFVLTSVDEMKAWFQGNGDEKAGEYLAGELLKLMPDLRYRSLRYGSCVTSFTPTGKPVIEAQSEHIIALTGGNGAGAKCADELGRLGALVASGEGIPEGFYDTSFRARE